MTQNTSKKVNYLGQGESANDRVLNLSSADIEHEFWHNGFDIFIKNLVPAAHQTAVQIKFYVDIEDTDIEEIWHIKDGNLKEIDRRKYELP